MTRCTFKQGNYNCGSYAFNLYKEDIDQGSYCDRHYWQDQAQKARAAEQEPVALPCCGYADASAIKWNTHNQVVQCHNCGQVYTPQRQPLTQEQRDAIVRPAVPNDWNDYEVIDAVEAAHGIKEKNGA